MFKNAGRKIAEGAMAKMSEGGEKEWATFECFAGHHFALHVEKDMLVDEYIHMLTSLTCPICQTKSIKTKGTQ